MDAHSLLTAVTCAGHLALAVFIWVGRGRNPIAPPLALLFLDAFAWNFADLAYVLSANREWHSIDRFFSSLMPILALRVVVGFVGKARSLQRPLRAGYVVSMAVALLSRTSLWWKLLLAVSVAALSLATALLVRYRRTLSDGAERARTDLILWAMALGTALGSTDLWFHTLPFRIPRLSSFGTLVAMALVAAGALRLRLLGRQVPVSVAVYAVVAGALSCVAYLAAIRWLSPHVALLTVSAVTLGVAGFAILRDFARTAALARERAQRLVILGRFSDQLAHDLKNPLAALKGALQFLAVERQQGRSLDPQSEFIDVMLEQVSRMQHVIDDYRRIGQVEPVLARTSLNDVVRGVVSLQRFAVVPGVTLLSALDGALPDCVLDRELIEGALENVLRNAYEAMPEGGTVTVRTEVSPEASAVAVVVEDQGHGMNARDLERATDEFFTTKASGSGLGLNFASRSRGRTADLSSCRASSGAARKSFSVCRLNRTRNHDICADGDHRGERTQRSCSSMTMQQSVRC